MRTDIGKPSNFGDFAGNRELEAAAHGSLVSPVCSLFKARF